MHNVIGAPLAVTALLAVLPHREAVAVELEALALPAIASGEELFGCAPGGGLGDWFLFEFGFPLLGLGVCVYVLEDDVEDLLGGEIAEDLVGELERAWEAGDRE